MATTSYEDFTAAVRGIGDRTDAAGAAVGDINAEEDRLIQSIVTEGAVTTDAFVVQHDSGMDITVGSGSAKADLYAVQGEVSGQGVYLARLDTTPILLTCPAADASQDRTDEVYLVIADAAYDGGSVSLPRIGYRQGDPGSGAPGVDLTWKASAKLATVVVRAGQAQVDPGDITDERVDAETTLVPSDILRTSGGTMVGDLVVASGAEVVVQSGGGIDLQAGSQLTWAGAQRGLVYGVDHWEGTGAFVAINPADLIVGTKWLVETWTEGASNQANDRIENRVFLGFGDAAVGYGSYISSSYGWFVGGDTNVSRTHSGAVVFDITQSVKDQCDAGNGILYMQLHAWSVAQAALAYNCNRSTIKITRVF